MRNVEWSRFAQCGMWNGRAKRNDECGMWNVEWSAEPMKNEE